MSKAIRKKRIVKTKSEPDSVCMYCSEPIAQNLKGTWYHRDAYKFNDGPFHKAIPRKVVVTETSVTEESPDIGDYIKDVLVTDHLKYFSIASNPVPDAEKIGFYGNTLPENVSLPPAKLTDVEHQFIASWDLTGFDSPSPPYSSGTEWPNSSEGTIISGTLKEIEYSHNEKVEAVRRVIEQALSAIAWKDFYNTTELAEFLAEKIATYSE